MSWLDPNWKYHNAEESRKPGYLKERFEQVRQELREKEEREKKDSGEQAGKVRKIGRDR